jgi:hypothetical protein
VANDSPSDITPQKAAPAADPVLHPDLLAATLPTPDLTKTAPSDASLNPATTNTTGTDLLTTQTLSATYGPGALVLDKPPVIPGNLNMSSGFLDMTDPYNINSDVLQQELSIANSEAATLISPTDNGGTTTNPTAGGTDGGTSAPATGGGDGSNPTATADGSGDLSKSPVLDWLFTPDAPNPGTVKDAYPDGNPVFDEKNKDGVEVKGVDSPTKVVTTAGDQTIVYDKTTHSSVVSSKDGVTFSDDGTHKAIYDAKIHGTVQWDAKEGKGQVIGPDGNVVITFTSQADLTKQLQERLDKKNLVTMVQGHEAMQAAIRTAVKNQKPGDDTVQQFTDGQGNIAILSQGVLYETNKSGAVTIQKGDSRYRIEDGVAMKETRDSNTGIVSFTQTSDLSSIPGLQIKGKSVLLNGQEIIDSTGKLTVGSTTVKPKDGVALTHAENGLSKVTSGGGASSVENSLGTLTMKADGTGSLTGNADGTQSTIGDSGKTLQFNQNGISDIGGAGQTSVIMNAHDMQMKTADDETTTAQDGGGVSMTDAQGNNIVRINSDGSLNVADKIEIDSEGHIHAAGGQGSGQGGDGTGKNSPTATSAIALHMANMADISSAFNLQHATAGQVAAFIGKLNGEMASLGEFANLATSKGLLQYAEKMIAASEMTQAALGYVSSISTDDRSTQVSQPQDRSSNGDQSGSESTVGRTGTRPVLSGRVGTTETVVNETNLPTGRSFGTETDNRIALAPTGNAAIPNLTDNSIIINSTDGNGVFQADNSWLFQQDNRDRHRDDLAALNQPFNGFNLDQLSLFGQPNNNPAAINQADNTVAYNLPDNPVAFDQPADPTTLAQPTLAQPDAALAYNVPDVPVDLNQTESPVDLSQTDNPVSADPPETFIALSQPENIFTNQREVSGGGIVAEELIARNDQTSVTADYSSEPLPRLELAGEGMVSDRPRPSRKADFETGMVSDT